MSKIGEILKIKGSEIRTIQQDQTAFQAIEEMLNNGVGSLIVKNKGEVAGIVTERDYLRRVTLKSKAPKEVKVSQIMTTQLICVDPDYSVEECMAVMTRKKIRHLPVFENKHLVGVVSIGDLVKQASHDRQAEVKYLTDYISGKYPA